MGSQSRDARALIFDVLKPRHFYPSIFWALITLPGRPLNSARFPRRKGVPLPASLYDLVATAGSVCQRLDPSSVSPPPGENYT